MSADAIARAVAIYERTHPVKKAVKPVEKPVAAPIGPQMEAAHDVLDSLEGPFRVKRIILGVSIETGVTVRDIIGERQACQVVAARHEAIWRVSEATGWSLTHIAVVFNKHHSTILHALRKVRAERAERAERILRVERMQEWAPSRLAEMGAEQ